MDRERIRRVAKIGLMAVAVWGVFIFVALLIVRGWRIEESDVVGSYTAHWKSGIERLTLNDDGTYIQEVLTEGSDTPVTNSGTWEFSGGDVVLDGCLILNDGQDDIRPEFRTPGGIRSYRAEHRWIVFGRIRLGSDTPHALRKTD